MFHPTRGGTRGGQAEFKWTDVSADKDREHYLGHSINAPTGRWQKNKDVHWYNRDLEQSEADRREEIRKVKEAEEDALAVALGFKPAVRTVPETTPAIADGEAVSAPDATGALSEKALEKEEKHRRKQEKRERKDAKRKEKEERRREKEQRRKEEGTRPDSRGRDSYSRRRSPSPSRSRSPVARNRDFDDERGSHSRGYRDRQRSRSPDRRKERDRRGSRD
ncbi:hypothetical protein BOTBODRAFT_34439 [Botryobasidium botryosum FD-172 SS1]|uniref:Multiple myeloma tumor-associated protein 2-like N-terminal domain-containing protein n=1 Tax=Botryobasidium botryosum (strain FD-172 SS1) TaxID=930990 RepID=A0A067MCN7_BOTB1|nr:hypothetical protein BOTBODRAFT_34439 [Botryobasidium botryosum FD-172 SS1]